MRDFQVFRKRGGKVKEVNTLPDKTPKLKGARVSACEKDDDDNRRPSSVPIWGCSGSSGRRAAKYLY